MQDQVDKAEAALESHKLQLHDAQSQLAAAQEAAGRCGALDQEVKEKNLLIGKLRHEAVILNEHLTEALRQVRRDSSGTMVDRRLVTNLVLQFLAVPRADSKRFEILKLMASVLQWDEEEREKAGLQRAHDRGGFRFLGFGGAKPPPSPSRSGAGDEVRVRVNAVGVQSICRVLAIGSGAGRERRGEGAPAERRGRRAVRFEPPGAARRARAGPLHAIRRRRVLAAAIVRTCAPPGPSVHRLCASGGGGAGAKVEKIVHRRGGGRGGPLTTMAYPRTVLAVVVFALALCVHTAAVPYVLRTPNTHGAQVYLIRHGEKVDDDHIGLSPEGEERADCVQRLFSENALKVDAIFTQDYKPNGKRIRPYDTVKPLADHLGLPIDHHCDRDDEACAIHAITKAARRGAKRILVCWEHDALSDIAERLGVPGLVYPSERFDLVWQIADGRLVRMFSEECPELDDD